MRHCNLFPFWNGPIMPPSATPTSRVEALDLLRLVAVLGVVLYHFGFWGPAAHGCRSGAPLADAVAKYGFLGVPAFFVISGFVIAYSAEGRTATGFAIARFSGSTRLSSSA